MQIGLSAAVPHNISAECTSFDGNYAGYNWVVNYNDGTVGGLAIWNPTDGTYDPLTCRTDGSLTGTSDGTSLTISSITLTSTKFYLISSEKFCTFEYNGAVSPATFKIYIRTFQTTFPPVAGGSDLEFILQLDAQNGFSNTFTGSNIFTPGPNDPQVIGLTPDVIVMNIDTLDDTGAQQTTFNIGDTATLRFSLENTGYLDGTSISGARVTSCEYSSASDFSVSLTTMVGTNGCFVSTDLFSDVDGGFSRHSSSAMTPGTPNVKTYYAHSPSFGVVGFHSANVGGSSDIYIRCDVTFCFDDSVATVGTCGGDHCDPSARKRREVVEPHTSVFTNITVLHRQDKQTSHPADQHTSCDHCSETGSYKVVVATLGTLTAFLFAAMVFTYSSAQSVMTAKHHKQLQAQTAK